MALVSIITPTFNSSAYIRRTYESIFNQTERDWEWIVVDDASSDETLSVLRSIALNDPRVVVLSHTINSGAASSRNDALIIAKSRYIAFLDSDDLWLPDKLSLQLSTMINESAVFSFTGFRYIHPDGYVTSRTVDTSHIKTRFSYRDFLSKRATFCCSSVVLLRSFIDGQLMPDIRTGQDYAFWLSLLKCGGEAILIPRALTLYRSGHSSLSRNKLRKAIRHFLTLRQFAGLGYLHSLYFFTIYTYRAVFKKI